MSEQNFNQTNSYPQTYPYYYQDPSQYNSKVGNNDSNPVSGEKSEQVTTNPADPAQSYQWGPSYYYPYPTYWQPPTTSTSSQNYYSSYNSVVMAAAASTVCANIINTYNSVPPALNKEPSNEIKAVGGGESKWSPELKEYVRKAYDSTENTEERDQMDRILKQKLEYVFKNNVNIDWEKEPIPVPPSRSLAAIKNRGGINVVRNSALNPRRGRGLATGMLKGTGMRLPGMGQHSFAGSPKKQGLIARNNNSFGMDYLASKMNKSLPEKSDRNKSSSDMSCSSDEDSSGKSRSAFEDSYQSSRMSSRSPTPKRNKDKGIRSDGLNSKEKKRIKSRFSDASLGELGGQKKMNQRANRFKEHLTPLESNLSGRGSIGRSTSAILLNVSNADDETLGGQVDLTQCKIVGKMTELEKPYLRLTRAPEPEEVRPLEVLRLSLNHIKSRWENKCDYRLVCEQFKSIRQDLTVQCIEDDFSATVYESHADVALEVGDYEEFHQCQSQLMRLHRHGYGIPRRLEFTAYRILYYMFTLDYLGISIALASLKSAHKDQVCVKFALQLRDAWALGNHVRFFKLVYPENKENNPPGKCRNIIDWIIPRERREAAKRIFKIFRPHIDMEYVAKVLAFRSPNNPDEILVDDCLDFLVNEFGVEPTIFMPREKVDCKAAWSAICAAVNQE